MVRMICLGFALTFSMVTMANPEKDSPIVLVPAKLTLSVGADGKPGNVACKPEVMKAMCPLLVKAVSGWTFEPGQREGVPTSMNVGLTLYMVAFPKPLPLCSSSMKRS